MIRFVIAAALAAVPVLAPAQEVLVQRPVPYSEDADIASNIRNECKLQEQLPDYIRQFAAPKGIEVRFADEIDTAAPGRVLQVEIRDALSMGNAWTGHRKSTSVRGRLFEDGELIGSFRGRRDSMGGAFAGYKGSCSVLGRTVKTLGQDIAAFLAAPTMDAELGDLK